MLKLDDISVYGTDNFFVSWIKRMGTEELKFIKEKKLENFGQLEVMIREGQEVPEYFKKLLELTKKYINKYHVAQKQPQICNYNTLIDIDKNDLEVTENEVFVKNFILNAIIDNGWRVTFLDIQELNIKSLRFFLSHTTPNGNMSLKLLPKIGDTAIEKIIKGLYYYEEQIKRQNLEKHEIGSNLFTLNQEAKQSIVEKELNMFVEYLLSFSFDFIWGKRSETTNRLLEGCIVSKSKNAVNNRNRLVETLTNYMTLTELENGAIENNTLDRFMLTKTMEKEEE